jgi:hypothetical protein
LVAGRVRVVVLGICIGVLVAWPLAKGVSTLLSKFRSRAPSVSIDFPGQSSGVGREVVVYGRVDPGTISGALLLIAAEAGEKWELAQEIDTHDSTWRAKVTLACGKGTTHRLAVVRIDVPFDDKLREALAPRVPDWLQPNTVDGGGRRKHRHRRDDTTAFQELPPGATLVAAVDVFVVDTIAEP